MKHVLLLAALLLAASGSAHADTHGVAVGAIYLSGAPDHRQPNVDFEAGTPFDFYVLTAVDYAEIGHADWNDGGGMIAWEGFFGLPPEITIVEWSHGSPATLDMCDPVANVCATLGAILPAGPQPRVLMHLRGLVVGAESPSDVVIRMGPSVPSHFAGQSPGWVDAKITLECATDQAMPVRCYRPFARTPKFTLNCVDECVVGTQRRSWGNLKSRYD